MTQREFHNALRILLHIDFEEFAAACPDNAGFRWAKFQDNPHRFFIAACDDEADALWKIIEGRQTRNPK